MNKILQRLNDNRNLIDASLHGYLDIRRKVPDRLLQAMQYSVYAGGKRIRPSLVMEFCEMFGGSQSAAIPMACALECVHTYSLIHDDLPCMDNDDLRRGKPTNHRMFGESTALLAGDALLTFAFELIAKRSMAGANDTVAALGILAECAGMTGMVGGQQLDLEGEKKDEITIEEMKTVHRLKTGALFRAACLLGCCAAGISADKAKCEAASEYAEHLGLAFQIIDDVLDVVGSEKHLGKKVNKDVSHNKKTFLTFLTVEEARTFAKAETETACRAIEFYPKSEILIGIARNLENRIH